MRCAIWYNLYNLKNVKNTHGGVLLLVLKVTLLHGCFSRFLNCTKGTKSRNAPHIMMNILGMTECRNLSICEINLLVCSVFIA